MIAADRVGVAKQFGDREKSPLKLPDSPYGLFLEHNTHKASSQTVELGCDAILDDEWVSEEEHEKAIETNELWTIQWHPTSIATSHYLAASTLKALLKGVEDLEDSLAVKH